ncbi:Palmitoyl-protein thioesterase 1 [Halotydeus destructor]|nr:Palmitoyl-protein thioesterase 1 [Halotydeus destructor]
MVKVLAVFGETVVNNEVTGGGNQGTPTPIVLYHGMGDTCCASGSIGAIKKFLEKNIEGVYVHSLKIGNSSKDEFANSYFMDSNEQIELACDMIRKDDYLQGGYHAIGFSQGGQFVRAIAQRCPNPPIKNLVTFGAQHQGVYGLPRCSGEKDTLCNLARELLHFGAYTDYVQKRVVQAQYWHDPRKEEVYKAKSLFLADINNERLPRNQTYVENLNKLENFVMIKFVDDTIVDPPETESFGFFVPGQGKVIQTMKETDLYKEDYIGLRKLDEAGRVKIYDVPGNHLQINMTWFATELIPKYLQ